MSVTQRLKPVQSFQTTLDNITMPITILFLSQMIFIILNLSDDLTDDNNNLADVDRNINLINSTGYTIMAILVAFWIGVTAIKGGGTVGDGLIGGIFVGFGHGLISAAVAEFFSETILRGDLGVEMIQYIVQWMVLFMLVAMAGAGLTEDWLSETKSAPIKVINQMMYPPAKTLKKTAKKAIKKPAKKKTTKKAAKAEEDEEILE